MNVKLHPAAIAGIIIVVLGVAAFLVFQATGPTMNGPKEPVSMGKMMGLSDKSKSDPNAPKK